MNDTDVNALIDQIASRLSDPTQPFGILYRFAVLAAHRNDTLASAHASQMRTRSEPGCIRYDFATDSQDANQIVLYEVWSDLEALRVHFGLQSFRDFMDTLLAAMDGAPEMQVFTPLEQ